MHMSRNRPAERGIERHLGTHTAVLSYHPIQTDSLNVTP